MSHLNKPVITNQIYVTTIMVLKDLNLKLYWRDNKKMALDSPSFKFVEFEVVDLVVPTINFHFPGHKSVKSDQLSSRFWNSYKRPSQLENGACQACPLDLLLAGWDRLGVRLLQGEQHCLLDPQWCRRLFLPDLLDHLLDHYHLPFFPRSDASSDWQRRNAATRDEWRWAADRPWAG